VPWIVVVVLTHTFIVQRKTGGLKRTNLAMATLSFLLVIYATFLTRSGVLSDASVHSFSDPGKGVYAILLLFLIVMFLLVAVPLAVRYRKIATNKISSVATSRDFALALGTAFLMAMAALIAIGTSWSLISKLFLGKSSTIETTFYNEWTLPLAIAMLVANIYSLKLNWKSTPIVALARKLALSISVSLVATAVLVSLGVRDTSNIVIAFASFWTLFLNLEILIRVGIKTPRKIGAYLSHAGIAFLMLGILGSGVLSESKTVSLTENESREIMGYKFTFSGNDELKQNRSDRQTFAYKIKAESNSESFEICPLVYYSDYNNRQEAFFEPGIAGGLLEDIYISPKSSEDKYQIFLLKNQAVKLPVDTNVEIRLGQFNMNHSEDMSEDSLMKIGVVVIFRTQTDESADTLFTEMNLETMECRPVWKQLRDSKYLIGFTKFRPDAKRMAMSQAVIGFAEGAPDHPEVLSADVFTIEISRKPFISLVWIGVILVVLGYFWTISKKKKA
jgi:cytochrome c-type biogenesis protein CcmF